MKDEILMVPIDQIRILNPRHRDPKKFAVVVQSIKNLGLKKPIQVSIRSADEAAGLGYDLVCGQGRIEACRSLGWTEIPAIVVEVPKEERLLRSLVENMARRFPSPQDLMLEIERLKGRGYSNVEIGKKLDMSDTVVGGYLTLKKAGEERLLDAALSGSIPVGIAIEIAKADTVELQRDLLKAYEKKQLNGVSIRTVKRLMDHRRFIGKQRSAPRVSRKDRNSADSLVSAYRRESERQKRMIKMARLCDGRLIYIKTAFGKLLKDDNFLNLLKAEDLNSLPKWLGRKAN